MKIPIDAESIFCTTLPIFSENHVALIRIPNQSSKLCLVAYVVASTFAIERGEEEWD